MAIPSNSLSLHCLLFPLASITKLPQSPLPSLLTSSGCSFSGGCLPISRRLGCDVRSDTANLIQTGLHRLSHLFPFPVWRCTERHSSPSGHYSQKIAHTPPATTSRFETMKIPPAKWRMWLPLASLLAKSVAETQAQQSCYYPNGDLSKDDSPCSSDGGTCCPLNWECLSNGLCYLESEDYFERHTCTDQSWGDDCPELCTQSG